MNEYQADELAEDSDDAKKISKAEKAAEKKAASKRKRAASRGGPSKIKLAGPEIVAHACTTSTQFLVNLLNSLVSKSIIKYLKFKINDLPSASSWSWYLKIKVSCLLDIHCNK